MKYTRRYTTYDIRHTKKGVALILTFIFMVTLIIIVAAYLLMATSGIRSINAQINNASAFYLAEAGLNKAIWFLMNTAPDNTTDGSWRTTDYPADPGSGDNDPKQDNLGDGTYTMWVQTSVNNALITGRGTINNIQRKIQQEVNLWPNAFNYAVYGNDVSSILQLRNNVTINGHLYYDYDNGSVQIIDSASVAAPYYVYADTVTGDGTKAPSAPDPVSSFPTLDNTSYTGAGGTLTNFDSDISNYNTSSSYLGYSGSWTSDPNGTVNITLSGNTLYYENFKAKNNSTITGYGTIVSDSEVKLENTTSVTPSGGTITIISREKMEIKDSATVVSGTTLYSKGEGNKELKVKDSASVSSTSLLAGYEMKIEGGTVSSSTLYHSASNQKIEVKGSSTTVSSSSLLSREKIEIKDEATVNSDSLLYISSGADKIEVKNTNTSFDGSILSNNKVKIDDGTVTGIIYAAGEAELKGSSTINGAVVSDTYKNNEIKDDVTINYDSSYFPGSIPSAGLEIEPSSVTDTWREI